MTDRQRNGLILLIVAGLIAASAVVITSSKTRLGLDLKGGVQLVYQGQPTPQTPHVTQDALTRAVDIMRQRVDQLGVAEPQIQTSGGNQITVGLPNVKATGTTPIVGQHCLLSGPDDNMQDLISGLPAGVTASQGQLLTIQQGTVVLQAADASSAHPTPPNSPSAQFYVLRDHVALLGS